MLLFVVFWLEGGGLIVVVFVFWAFLLFLFLDFLGVFLTIVFFFLRPFFCYFLDLVPFCAILKLLVFVLCIGGLKAFGFFCGCFVGCCSFVWSMFDVVSWLLAFDCFRVFNCFCLMFIHFVLLMLILWNKYAVFP